MYNFWISKKEPYEIILPFDLQSHFAALCDNGLRDKMNEWNEASWRTTMLKPYVRQAVGEYHPETHRPLNDHLQVVILERWPTREAFAKMLAEEAEKLFPKLKDEKLYQAGLVFPVSGAFLKKHLKRLPDNLQKLAETTWRLDAA